MRVLLGVLVSLSLVSCLSGNESKNTGTPAPAPTEPSLADQMKDSPFDLSSIALPEVIENPKFTTPESIDVIFPAETIRPTNTSITTIERTLSLGENSPGRYLLKLQNGNYGPFLASNCNLIADKNLKFQCQFDNLVETYEKSFTRMYTFNMLVNGVKVGTTTNLLDTTKSYLEIPITLNNTENVIKITYQGYPSSFMMLKIEKYPETPMPPTALFTIGRLTGTTATGFAVNAKDSFDSYGGAHSYEWNFGDGTPLETAQKSTHLYAVPGEYPVNLKVTNQSGLSSVFGTTVLVRPVTPPPETTLKKPIGILTYNIIDPNETRFMQFSAQGSSDPDGVIIKYEWDFGDKTKFEGTAAGHLYKKGGTYTVRLTLTDDSGLKTVVQRLVSVKEASEITLAESVFQKEFTGSMVNPTKYTEMFSIDPTKIGSLYKVTIENADGMDHPIKTCTGAKAEILQCKYHNLLQTSYINLSRATAAYVTVNGVRLSDSTTINKNKYLYLTYAHLLKENTIQVVLYGYPTASIKIKIERLEIGTEVTAPELSTNFASNTLTTKAFMNVKAYDTSSVSTLVLMDGGGVIYSTAEQDFDFNLVEGLHNYTIQSSDAWGNTSQITVENVTADFTDPGFYLTAVGDVYSKTLPAKLKVTVNTSEPCKSVKVNNVSLAASSDKMVFTGTISFAAEGSYQLTSVVTDLSGRISTDSTTNSVNIYHDSVPPVISYQQQESYITNQSAFYIPINVSDDYPVNVIVKVNGAIQFETTATEFRAPLLLTREGANAVSLEARDLAGNKSGILSLTVTRDTKPPIVSFVTPINNAYVDGYVMPITIKSNERLSAAYVNGVAFEDLSSTTLSTTLYSNGDQLQLTAVDLAGNVSFQNITVRPIYAALNPDLTSISIDDQLKKILVKGAVGATRPNLSVKISTGLFSTTTVQAAGNGSFSALVDIAESVAISVYDPYLRSTLSTVLVAGMAAETLVGGQVRDELNKPMPGVTVGILNTSMSVKTNSNGVFSFTRAKFPAAMVTGDQELVVDGGSVPKSYTKGLKKYGKTNIKIRIGLAKNNTINTPVFLAPTYTDGTATSISVSSGAQVQDIHAPGVVLDIPAGSTSFPSGKSTDLISVQTLPAEMATVPTPDNVRPTSIVALEPSGTTFSEPVKLTLPNSNNLPAGTDMIIMLMNSQTGLWEVGGVATVSDNGASVVTKGGQGIKHFSLAYATITAPVFRQIGAQDKPGADTFNGAMSTSLTLPSFKSMDADVAPSLSYKSAWAAPTAVVTNLFDFPKTKTTIEPFYIAGQTTASGNKVFTHCWDVIPSTWRECRSGSFDYYQQFDYEYYFSNLEATIKPDKVETKFQVANIQSDTKTYTDLPQRATMTYAMPLLASSSGSSYLNSGIYNYQADYKIYLDNLIIGTKSEKSTLTTSIVHGDTTVTPVSNVTPYEEKNSQLYPQSLTGEIFVQNYSQSPYGTGWRLNGAQKIVNPESNKIMIEEADGSIATYSLKNTIDTALDLGLLGADIETGVALNNFPKVAYVKGTHVYEATLGSQSVPIEIAALPEYQGSTTLYDFYNFTKTVNNRYEDCINRWDLPGGNVCVEWGMRDHWEPAPYSFCSADNFTYSLKPKPVQLLYQGSRVLGLDGSYHNFFSAEGAVYNKHGSEMNIDATVSYANPYRSTKEDHVINFRNLCQSLGMNCSAPENIMRNEVAGTSACGNLNVAGPHQLPQRGLFNAPSAIAHGLEANTVVIADYGSNMVRVHDIESGAVLRNIIGTTQMADQYCTSGCPADGFSVNHPRGVAVGINGTVYVSTESGYIIAVSPSGIARTIAGNNLQNTISNSDIALNMRLNKPYGLALDNERNYLYFSDSGSHRVMRLDLSSGMATTVAGNGTVGSLGDNGAALDANLNTPTHISVDNEGNLFILDSGNQKIRKVVFNTSELGGISFLATAKDNSSLVKTSAKFIRTNRDGLVTEFDLSGKQISSTDRVGRRSRFEYNSENQLTKIILPDNKGINYYYSGGRLGSIVDDANRSTMFSYNGAGQLTQVTFPNGKRKSFVYTSSGLLKSETNEEGNSTQYDYNIYNRVTKITNAENKAVYLEDMASSNLSSQTAKSIGDGESQTRDTLVDANGNKTTLLKDVNGYIAVVTDALGRKTEIHRDLEGRVTKIVKPDGTHTKTTYDSVTGDVIKAEDIENNIVTEFKYNQFGQLIWKKDGRGQVYTKSYDPSTGLLTSETGPNGSSMSYTYSPSGQMLTKSTQSANGILTWSNEYNAQGQLSKQINPDGKFTLYSYNEAGQTISVETNSSSGTSITWYYYDSVNRLTSVKTPNGEVTSYEYLSTGELSKIIDPKGKETRFTYNKIGKLISKTGSDGSTYQFSYDDNGNLLTEVDPKGQIRTYGYNELNQMVQAIFPDDVVTNQYDANGEISRTSNSTSVVEFLRDSRKRITNVNVTGLNSMANYPQYSLAYSFDENDNKVLMQSNVGSIAYSFDALNRLTQMQNSWGDSFAFAFDQGSRLTQIARPGSVTDYTYGAGSQVERIDHLPNSNPSLPISFVSYSYDQRNYPVQKRSPSSILSYNYDKNGQLTAQSEMTEQNSPILSSPSNETFSYDEIGKRLTDKNGNYVYDNTSQRLQEDWQYLYSYDLNGNLTLKMPKDTSKESYIYSYSSKNQLIQIKITNGLLGQVKKQITYSYDVLGRRMQKSVEEFTNSNLTSTSSRKYIYDGDNILAEYNANNYLLARYTHSPMRADDILSANFTGDAVSEGLSQSQGSAYYLKDILGSITDIVTASGSLVQRYEYSSFGRITSVKNVSGTEVGLANAPVKTSFTYTGREWDEDAGVYYYRARYYDASMGRFLQQDPDPGKTTNPITVVNKYSYVGNNPVGLTDPTGLSWLGDFFGGSGGFLGDLITAALTVGIIVASGGTAAAALIAVGSVAGGAAAAAGVMAAFQGGNFFDNFSNNFHTLFRVGATFLAGSAIAANTFGGGIGGAGGNGLQGYVLSKNPYFGGGTGLTIGSASTYNVGSGFAAHEFGHTLQFIGLSMFTRSPEQLFGAYLAVGALGGGLRFGGVPDAYNPIEFYH